jgi:hypothetical protein
MRSLAYSSAFVAIVVSSCNKMPDRRTDVETCEIHSTQLLEGEARVRYGLPLPPTEAEMNAERTDFPNAWSLVEGGCLRGEHDRARVRYCPKCRDAQKLWYEQHPQGFQSI